MRFKINYIVIPFLIIAVSLIGGNLTAGGMDWYKTINLPGWVPSGAIIGTAWTIIYILSAISALIVFNKAKGNLRTLIGFLWLANGALNILWSALFFRMHYIGAAFFEALLLFISVIFLIIYSGKVSKTSAWLLVPYALWVLFASNLTFVIWQLN